MVIAITSDGKTLETSVSQHFELCNYLLIVNTSGMSVKAIENETGFSGEVLAKKIIDFNCEGIITGKLNRGEFDILADAYITRYLGSDHSGAKALDLMKKRELALIRTFDGAQQCEGNHDHQL
ncbi:NifB/NifX family molybdenum-iron cluster-binding protein [Acetobacterium sp.]|uniref:NifB/NifX family molybdenum-iron cluster-binding protein n=1 Tax=Acetobacterium sp. TaxID=1872094 RepID=UPI002F3FB734